MRSITIEPIADHHAEAILRLAQDPSLGETSSVPTPCTAEHVARWIADNAASPRSVLTFAVLDEGAVVGTVTLKRLDAPDHSGELAYWIGKDHQGKGYATAAARLAVDYAFHRLMLEYLHSHFLKAGNAASGTILVQKCGFVPDANRADLPVAGRFAERFPGDHWTFVRREKP